MSAVCCMSNVLLWKKEKNLRSFFKDEQNFGRKKILVFYPVQSNTLNEIKCYMKRLQKNLPALKVNANRFGGNFSSGFISSVVVSIRELLENLSVSYCFSGSLLLTPSPEFAYCSVTSLCRIKKQKCLCATVCYK